MSTGFFNVPEAINEIIYSYAPGSPERDALKKELSEMRSQQVDVAMIIDGKEVRTENKVAIRPPHDHKHILGYYHRGDASHVKLAIDAALKAKKSWAELPWEHRASVFLKAANLLAGKFRFKMNAATMLGQSKNPFQAEIDSAAELVDFYRFNVDFMRQVYSQQPISDYDSWNRVEQRPLEGFIFALTPFNFTSIAGNLPTAPAMMGNTVVWKVSNTQVYSARIIMELLMEAGLPDGVINLVFVSGPVAGDVIFSHPDFAGIHYTGSTEVFQNIWKTIGNNIHMFKSYPRIVGETGGKDFIMVHNSADIDQVVTAIVRGAFEYQGQKCSAVSRTYIPKSMWNELQIKLKKMIAEVKMGPVEDFRNFFNAVIDENSFDKLKMFIDNAKSDKEAEVIIGGNCDKSNGYFIEPTVILAKKPDYITMREELFGPVLSIYVYEDDKFEETLDILDKTSIYALTGAIFSRNRYIIDMASRKLENAAGNFYINDKPTGAVVGQQPFGGARGSGTNDKAGSLINLLRWVSPRTIKENFDAPSDFRYPFQAEE
ncbi:MAG: L-glutamate gamma-semialdehyde dehydrogenase [Bacteroidales bacterium]|nr:L-glutamate gamma-semialdehyde dehydrogenase [Bacteroidales bacterium]MCF8390323.1 L-glutamate gamma-semialdehyde dehydrogenase [Bacteroidales bacterium]